MLPGVLILALAALRLHRGKTGGDAALGQFPGFVLVFAALVIANSVGLIPPDLAHATSTAAQWMLIAALAALGLRTSLRSFREVGALYVVLLLVETLFLLGLGIAAISLFAPAA